MAQGSGSIINISSTFGHTGGAGASTYVASKHAVEGLTKSAALEASGFGVRVNAVAPGPIDCGMLTRFAGTDERKAGLIAGVPLKRLGRPEEIAETIVFLSSGKASFITSATIRGRWWQNGLCDSYTLKTEAQSVLDELWGSQLIPFQLTAHIVESLGEEEYIIRFHDSRLCSVDVSWKTGDSFKDVKTQSEVQ